jgi:hypothetical protein
MDSLESLVADMKRANARVVEARKAMEASPPAEMASHKPALDAAAAEVEAALKAIEAHIEAADDSDAARARLRELMT